MTETHTDIPSDSWIDRVPAAVRPYLRLMRLDRPIGTWLLLFPCWWGLALAPDQAGLTAVDYARFALLFALGAVIMRGAGCVVNDILDADIDARVARTRTRPIPSGQVSKRQAAGFLVGLLLAGLLVLLQFNWTTIAVGAASLLLVFPYPLMKRITWWPQAWLGLTFNWGALVGWTAATGSLGWPAVLLYAAGVAWTLGYDTIYAHQDKEDDARIGVKSTALRLGSASRGWVAGFYAATLAGIATALVLAGLSAWGLVALVGAAAQAVWQVRGWRLDDAADSLMRFKSNARFAALVLAALAVGHLGAPLWP